MGNQNNVKEGQSPARSGRTAKRGRGRKVLIWMGGVLAVLLILLLAGWIYEPMAEAADAKAYPPPGQ